MWCAAPGARVDYIERGPVRGVGYEVVGWVRGVGLGKTVYNADNHTCWRVGVYTGGHMEGQL